MNVLNLCVVFFIIIIIPLSLLLLLLLLVDYLWNECVCHKWLFSISLRVDGTAFGKDVRICTPFHSIYRCAKMCDGWRSQIYINRPAQKEQIKKLKLVKYGDQLNERDETFAQWWLLWWHFTMNHFRQGVNWWLLFFLH